MSGKKIGADTVMVDLPVLYLLELVALIYKHAVIGRGCFKVSYFIETSEVSRPQSYR
jgi:hypothetical protein